MDCCATPVRTRTCSHPFTSRAVMMLIHAYFNIWCEAKSGWSTFCKRRTAVAKIESLDDATAEEIEKHADVCAICYQEMVAAKLTRCKHMFHAICLRKWLYMQVRLSLMLHLWITSTKYCAPSTDHMFNIFFSEGQLPNVPRAAAPV